MKRSFHLGDVLSVTTGRLLSPRGVSGLRDIIGFLARSEYEVTDTGCMMLDKPCAAALREQLPVIGALKPTNNEEPLVWFAKQVARYGETVEVEQPEFLPL